MPLMSLMLLTGLTMVAFAGNSIFCRLALSTTSIDPASFTTVRLLSGALVLFVLVSLQGKNPRQGWSLISALALFAYAVALSFSYTGLTTATGALLLFGAVQATMIGYGLYRGERLIPWQWLGLLMALAGLVGLLSPGISAPPMLDSLIMMASGVAWGVYSLRGKGAGDPTLMTAGNFMLAAVMAVILSMAMWSQQQLDVQGVTYAMLSGGLTSGLGYAIWYRVLPWLRATQAATIQLSVPVITAVGGLLFVSEPITWRFTLACAAILGGIALVILPKSTPSEK